MDAKLHVMSIEDHDNGQSRLKSNGFRSTLLKRRSPKKEKRVELENFWIKDIEQLSQRPVKSPKNNQYPLGAHYSGHYSRVKQDKRLITSTLDKRPVSQKVIKEETLEEDEQFSKLPDFKKKSVKTAPQPTAEKEISIDEEDIRQILLKLSDNDKQFLDVLSLLQDLNKKQASPQFLYDIEAIQTLMPILTRFSDDLEIQATITTILVDIYVNVEKAKDLYVKLDLIPILLKAGSVASKAILEEEKLNNSPADFVKKQGRRGSSAIQNNRMVQSNSNPSAFSANQIKENSGNRRQSFLKSRKSIISPVKEEALPIRPTSLEKDSIIDGLLMKYYQPQFLQNFNSSDQDYRVNTIKHILMQLEKIDKILLASSSTSLDVEIDDALKRILEDTEEMMQSEAVIFYEVDTNTGELILKTFNDKEELMLKTKKVFPAGSGLVGHVAATREILNVSDAVNNPNYHSKIDNGGLPNIRPEYILSCPLFVKNGPVIAVVQLVNKLMENGEIRPFDEEDEYLLSLLARTLTIVLTNARSVAKITETRKKVQVLLDTTKSLSSILDFDELIKKIMESAKELLNADRCTLFIKDSARKQLVAKILVRDKIEEIRIKMDAGIAGSVLMSGGK
jgi:GAF domain-containing protein